MDNSTLATPTCISPFYGSCFIILVTVFFILINSLLPVGNDWKWNNVLISWIHAVVISIWGTISFCLFPELIHDLIGYQNQFTFLMVCFSTGYFFYDLLDIVVNNKSRQYWEVILHHVTVSGMFYYNIWNCSCIAFTVVALTTEINTVFLHTRKMLQMRGAAYDSLVYRLNSIVNLMTFVVFRFGALAIIGYGVMNWRPLVSPLYYAMLSSSWAIMSVINSVLFWRILKNDVLRTHVKSKSEL